MGVVVVILLIKGAWILLRMCNINLEDDWLWGSNIEGVIAVG